MRATQARIDRGSTLLQETGRCDVSDLSIHEVIEVAQTAGIDPEQIVFESPAIGGVYIRVREET